MSVFRSLSEGGGFNLPFLVHLYNKDKSANIYLINDVKDFIHNGVTYESSNFTFNPATDGSATFTVELVNHDTIIDLLENNYCFNVDVIGVFNGEEIEEIGIFKHKYGEATWTGKSLELKLQKDDRGDMTFPALTFNSYNNRGNN